MRCLARCIFFQSNQPPKHARHRPRTNAIPKARRITVSTCTKKTGAFSQCRGAGLSIDSRRTGYRRESHRIMFRKCPMPDRVGHRPTGNGKNDRSDSFHCSLSHWKNWKMDRDWLAGKCAMLFFRVGILEHCDGIAMTVCIGIHARGPAEFVAHVGVCAFCEQ